MRKFQEYMSSTGKTDKKPVVDPSGDQIDMPTPKAKEDPHKKNKTKGKQPQVKEAATTDEYGEVPTHKDQVVNQQVKSERLPPFKVKKMYDTKDGVEQVKEYLSSQGNLVNKPKEELNADYPGPNPHAPQKSANSGKGWKGGKGTGTPAPYQASGMDAGQGSREHGFGDMGDTKYEPDVSVGDSEYVPGGKGSTNWPKSKKNENFLEHTRDLNDKQKMQYMLDECACQATSIVEAKRIAEQACHCDKTMQTLVHEIKSNGGLSELVESLMAHKETFVELNSAFADKTQGESRCSSLVRAMNESVGPPIGLGADSDEEDEDEDEDEYDHDHEDHHDDEDEDMDDDMNMDMADDDMDMDDIGMDDDDDEDEDGEDEDSMGNKFPMKLGKKSAMRNLAKAMRM